MLLLLAASAAMADPAADTYVRLRERLDEFRIVGVEQGESIPAGWRDDNVGVIKWADATVALGWEIGVLATEYHLLAHRDHYTAMRDVAWTADDTLDELAAALASLDRIDRVAESAFPEPCSVSEDLNGFFIRDDVPYGFEERFEGLSIMQSDFEDGPFLKEESQDQAHHILLGLALVKRFVPPGTTVDGVDLNAQAVDAGRRIVHWMADHDWLIVNPACDDKPVDRGPDARPVSTGFAATLRFLTDGEEDLDAEAWAAIWNGFRDPNALPYYNSDNRHMAAATAAAGDGWGETTFEDLVAICEVYAWTAYPLLHVALHGETAGWEEHGDDLLNTSWLHLEELGEDEPRGFAEGPAPFGWTSWHRYIRPGERQYASQPGDLGKRWWGGDYLLLHNLTRIVSDPLPEAAAGDEATPEGCGCRTGGVAGVLPLLLVPLLARRRRV